MIGAVEKQAEKKTPSDIRFVFLFDSFLKMPFLFFTQSILSLLRTFMYRASASRITPFSFQKISIFIQEEMQNMNNFVWNLIETYLLVTSS